MGPRWPHKASIGPRCVIIGRFNRPVCLAVPDVKDRSDTKTPLDHFILAKLEAEKLTPAGMASKRELIRRATFDLIGLPPTPGEVESFLQDDSPQAFARLIERLLQSPHYGERWGRYWLDVARYAEDQAHTFGVKPNTNAWRYRDWVINAFNSDMPYDRFVKLQLAADFIEKNDEGRVQHLPALGFIGLGAQYYKNSDKAKSTADELDDRVDTVTRGLLGLTVSCARCHEHKFDPIPQQDYYSLAGVFASCKLANLTLANKEQQQRRMRPKSRSRRRTMPSRRCCATSVWIWPRRKRTRLADISWRPGNIGPKNRRPQSRNMPRSRASMRPSCRAGEAFG